MSESENQKPISKTSLRPTPIDVELNGETYVALEAWANQTGIPYTSALRIARRYKAGSVCRFGSTYFGRKRDLEEAFQEEFSRQKTLRDLAKETAKAVSKQRAEERAAWVKEYHNGVEPRQKPKKRGGN